MGDKIRHKTEIIKSYEEYKIRSRIKALEKKVNKIYKFGFTFWGILGIIILLIMLVTML